MPVKPFQSERLHTIGGALLSVTVGLRKLKKVIDQSQVVAANQEMQVFWVEQLRKVEAAVEKLTLAFSELRGDMATEGENNALPTPSPSEAPLVIVHDPSHAAALQICLQLQALGFRTRNVDLPEELLEGGEGRCLVLGLTSPVSESLALCQRWRSTQAGAALPLIILTADEAEQDLLPFLALGIEGYCPRACVMNHIAVQVHAALKRGEIAQGQSPQTERSALGELALSLLLRTQSKLGTDRGHEEVEKMADFMRQAVKTLPP